MCILKERDDDDDGGMLVHMWKKKASHFYYYTYVYDCYFIYRDINKNGEHFKDDVKDYIITKAQICMYLTQIIF